MKSSLACLLAACALLAGAGCEEVQTNTQPSSNPALAIETFTGTLVKNGTAFYSFTVPKEGTVTVTLLSLTIAGAPTDLSITMGLGAPSGTTCRTTAMPNVTAGTTPQVSQSLTPAIYCVNVTDPGNLTADANFSINITRPR